MDFFASGSKPQHPVEWDILATAPSTSRRADAEKATFLDHADFDSGNCDRNFVARSSIC